MLIDTHTHLYLEEFDVDGGGTAAVERALRAGISHMVLPNVDLKSIEPMKKLHSRCPEVTSMAMGLHPSEITVEWRTDIRRIEDELADVGQWVAVGEIGIDLYWDKTNREYQMEAFEHQLKLAQLYNLPVIVHCREGLDETLEVLASVGRVRGVMHSFSGTAADVERILSVAPGFYFGINGIVTFKNSTLRDVMPSIPEDRLLLETDSPYLAPVPKRGRRCESAMLVLTAGHIANHLGISCEQLAEVTCDNARSLFGLKA